MVTDLLLQNVSVGGMQRVINEWMTKERAAENSLLPPNRRRPAEVDISNRTIRAFIGEARKRIRKSYPKDPSEEAAEQLAILKTIQQHGLRQNNAAGMKAALDAGKQINRMLGLDAPNRSQSDVTVRQGEKSTDPQKLPLADLIHKVMNQSPEKPKKGRAVAKSA